MRMAIRDNARHSSTALILKISSFSYSHTLLATLKGKATGHQLHTPYRGYDIDILLHRYIAIDA